MKLRAHDYCPELDGPQSFKLAGRITLCKGSNGGGQAYYANADELYKQQADTAKFMLGLGKTYLPGATEGFYTATRDLFDPAYQARMEGEAGLTAQSAIDSARATRSRDLARYGLNPGDGTWRSGVNADAMSAASTKAGAINSARMGIADRRLGASKDFYSALVGMPSDAASAASSAASGYANLGAAADQREANRNVGISNIAALGYETFFAADGGEVPALRKTSEAVWNAGEKFYAGGGLVTPVDRDVVYNDDGGYSYTGRGGIRKTVDAERAAEQAKYGRFWSRILGLTALRGQQNAGSSGADTSGKNIYAADFDRSIMRPTDPNAKRIVVDDSQHYCNGGKVRDGARRMALGGLFKIPPAPNVTALPQKQQQQNQPMPMRSGIKVAKMAKDGPSSFVDKMQFKGGRIAEKAGNFLGNETLAAEGLGEQGAATGTEMAPAIKAYNEAGMNEVAAGLGKGAGINPTTGLATSGSVTEAMLGEQIAGMGSEAAALTTDALASGMGTTAAAGAEAAAATGGLTSAMGTAAAAIPWLGAAIAIGSLFDLFNEGGEVGNRKDYLKGGTVKGQSDGSTTDDQVPAWLTHGEFVVNVEGVNLPGNRKKLEKMNREGLAVRAAQRGVKRRAA